MDESNQQEPSYQVQMFSQGAADESLEVHGANDGGDEVIHDSQHQQTAHFAKGESKEFEISRNSKGMKETQDLFQQPESMKKK